MRDGFVKVAAVTPDIRVADVAYNTQNICKMIDETVAKGAKVIVFPELCVTDIPAVIFYAGHFVKGIERSIV